MDLDKVSTLAHQLLDEHCFVIVIVGAGPFFVYYNYFAIYRGSLLDPSSFTDWVEISKIQFVIDSESKYKY